MQIPIANAQAAKLKSAEEEDKVAGALPMGVTPPTFYGDPIAFPTFWGSFGPMVHDNVKISKFYKMSYLKGSASDILNGFPTTGKNYDAAVKAVLKRYGRNQAIVRNNIEELLRGKKIEHDANQVRKMLDSANAKRSVLAQHDVKWDQIFVQILESQLSRQLLERWMRKISPLIDSDQAPNSDLLFEFLSTELTTMESLGTSRSRSDKDVQRKTRGKLKSDSNRREQQKEHLFTARTMVTSLINCVYCSQPRQLTDCQEFLSYAIQRNDLCHFQTW